MENIQNIIGKVVGEIEKKQGLTAQEIQVFWDSIQEKGDGAHSRVAEKTHDKITVCVDSPARLYKLNTQKTKFLMLIQRNYPDIKNIYFKIGKV